MELNKRSPGPQRTCWWQSKTKGHGNDIRGRCRGRERSHRKKRDTSINNQHSYFSLLREKRWQEFGVLYSLTVNRYLCEFSQPNSLFSPAVSSHSLSPGGCVTHSWPSERSETCQIFGGGSKGTWHLARAAESWSRLICRETTGHQNPFRQRLVRKVPLCASSERSH